MDIGGTSCDAALIQDGKPLLTMEGKVEKYPLRLPMLDVNTIGAGGGGIAWIDEAGGLRVGPMSAGASPGRVILHAVHTRERSEGTMSFQRASGVARIAAKRRDRRFAPSLPATLDQNRMAHSQQGARR